MVGDDDDDVSQRRAEEELRHPQCQRITYGVLHVALCDAASDSLFPIAAHARRQGVASTVATTPRPSQTSHELAARPSKITAPAEEPSTTHQAPSTKHQANTPRGRTSGTDADADADAVGNAYTGGATAGSAGSEVARRPRRGEIDKGDVPAELSSQPLAVSATTISSMPLNSHPHSLALTVF
ncbi:hypothetical protein PC9H_010243 [Pleurotus ostreatus]|uniref:Uncharacterized protein n=1 Tax=Pleurotus ostreatus TaxID=5322 RepID=A0A8H7DQD0_PLEOS|nr:uncharacterized protein PC9H_010243 [Pleurotus ostreatus]KAF7424932.1 hypothetical protein PC9H_010243 [Pleurotus ostreatus]